MNTNQSDNIQARLTQAHKDTTPKAVAKAMLLVEGLVTTEGAANKAIKESGLWEAEKSTKASFTNDFYSFLADEDPDYDTAELFIMKEETSANVKRHRAHYMNIWALVQRVKDAQYEG